MNKIKNLRVYQRALSLFGAGLVFTTGLTGCFNKNSNENKNDNNNSIVETQNNGFKMNFFLGKRKVETLGLENTLIPITNITLKNSLTDKNIENIDSIIVGNERIYIDLDEGLNLVFDENNNYSVKIGKILYPSTEIWFATGNEYYPASDFSFINKSNNEAINEFNFIFVKGQDNPEIVESFWNIVSELKEELDNKGIVYKEQELIDYVMVSNIDLLAEECNDLIEEIVGERNPNKIFADTRNVMSSRNSYFYQNIYEAGYNDENYEKIVCHVYNVLIDKKESKILEDLETRIKNIGEIADDEEFNEAVVDLLHDFVNAKDKNLILSDGAETLLQEGMEKLRGFYGVRFEDDDRFNEKGLEAIMYLMPYKTDPEKTQKNSIYNGADNEIIEMMSGECQTKEKGLTRTLEP